MEIQKELLLSVRTSLEVKGPYKLQIKKNENVVSTIKIRMKDDVTHIIQLSQGEYQLKVLRNDKDYIQTGFTVPNFENGSQVKLNITDSNIDIDASGLVKYISVDDLVEMLDKEGSSKKKNNNPTNIKKPKQEQATQGKNKSKPINIQNNQKHEQSQATSPTTINDVNQETSKENSNLAQISQKKEKAEELDEGFKCEVARKFSELFSQIEAMKLEIEGLKLENKELKESISK